MEGEDEGQYATLRDMVANLKLLMREVQGAGLKYKNLDAIFYLFERIFV